VAFPAKIGAKIKIVPSVACGCPASAGLPQEESVATGRNPCEDRCPITWAKPQAMRCSRQNSVLRKHWANSELAK
jgi:hypothetical protein